MKSSHFWPAVQQSLRWIAVVSWAEFAIAHDAEFFRSHVAPLLQQKCLSCHNDQSRKGELSLQTAAALYESNLVVPGDAESSRLMEVITTVAGVAEMPKGTDPLSRSEQEMVRTWLESGAEWPSAIRLSAPEVENFDWWSLRPLIRPAVPPVKDMNAIRSPIDAFIVAKLEERGLTWSPESDRRTLIRRVYFDLIGLPPSPAEVESFVSDPDPNAFEYLVDRLLESPHYGERWARHWLDVVHYADTHGYDKDKLRPHAWPYRDYVIRSFNHDKPYGRFVLEQIAGDALWPHTEDGITATGFISAGPWDFIGHAEVPESKIDGRIARHLDRDDMVTSTMNTFTSTTVQCARCHHHKFDPIGQEHYYALQSVFAALDRADRKYDKDPEIAKRRETLTARRSHLTEAQSIMTQAIEARAGDTLTALDEELGELAKQQQSAPANSDSDDPDEVATRIAERQSDRAQLLEALATDYQRQRHRAIATEIRQIDEALSELPAQAVVYAGTIHTGSGAFKGTGASGGKSREIHVLHRGDILQPQQAAKPGAIPLADDDHGHFELAESHSEADRRVALAHWLVDDQHPLTWRSVVNRVWAYHFGEGIVNTPNDFGRMGAQPTHPDLLDWLAVEFRDRGQSFKRLHRLIVTSAVYRQQSKHNRANHSIDGSNQYLWRMTRRRLSAEEIRDSVLAVSGQLDHTMYGPGMRLFVLERPEHSPHYEYHKHDPDRPGSQRRSVYRFIVRSQPDPFMTTLDCADSSQSVPKRDETVTPLQSLSLLNNKFILCMAAHFAKRVSDETDDVAQQVKLAYALVTGRRPSSRHSKALVSYAQEFGLSNTCRLILNLNEFVFVD